MMHFREFDAVDDRAPPALAATAIMAVMFWPEDPIKRVRWLTAMTIHASLGLLSAADEQEFFDRFGGAQSDVSDLLEEVPDLRLRGHSVGHVTLAATILARADASSAAIGGLQEGLSTALSKGGFQVRPRTMNNKAGPYYRFRSVAHLWAAHALWRLQNVDDDREQQGWLFPPEQFWDFLALGEEIRKRAEITRTPRSPTTVMKPGEAVVLPQRIRDQLPDIRLVVPPRLAVVNPES